MNWTPNMRQVGCWTPQTQGEMEQGSYSVGHQGLVREMRCQSYSSGVNGLKQCAGVQRRGIYREEITLWLVLMAVLSTASLLSPTSPYPGANFHM